MKNSTYNHIDVYKWIEEIIYSCDKPSQEESILNLIPLFEKKYRKGDLKKTVIFLSNSLYRKTEDHFSLML